MFGLEAAAFAQGLWLAQERARLERMEEQRLLAMPPEQRNALLQIRQTRALEQIARKDPTINVKTSIF